MVKYETPICYNIYMAIVAIIFVLIYYMLTHFWIREFLNSKYDNYAKDKYRSFTSAHDSVISDDSFEPFYYIASGFLYFPFSDFVMRLLSNIGINITSSFIEMIITIPLYHLVASLILLFLLDRHNQKQNKDYFANLGEKYLSEHQSTKEWEDDNNKYY